MKFPELTVRGTPYEMGVQIGKAHRNQIHKMLAYWLRGFNVKDAMEKSLRFQPIIHELNDRYMQEIQGVRDGAGITEAEALFLQVRWEISGIEKRAGCTTFAFNGLATKDGEIYSGGNHDVGKWARKQTLILRMQPDDGPQIMMMTYPGSITLDGMNEYGLSLSGNSIYGKKAYTGMPHGLYKRTLLNQKSVEDCIAYAERMVSDGLIGFSGNMTVCDASGDMACIELASGKLDVIRPKAGVGYVVHTNHLQTVQQQMLDLEVDRSRCVNTEGRLQSFQEHVDNRKDHIDLPFIQSVMADHDKHPDGICSHSSDTYSTAYSLIMLPVRKEAYVSCGNPCENVYDRYPLEA